MGVPPDQARALSYWEFTALRHGWNERHKSPDDAEPAELPDLDFVRERQRELYEMGIAGTSH